MCLIAPPPVPVHLQIEEKFPKKEGVRDLPSSPIFAPNRFPFKRILPQF